MLASTTVITKELRRYPSLRSNRNFEREHSNIIGASLKALKQIIDKHRYRPLPLAMGTASGAHLSWARKLLSQQGFGFVHDPVKNSSIACSSGYFPGQSAESSHCILVRFTREDHGI